MHVRKRSTFERFVSGALALSLACSGLLSNVSAAAAANPTPPETAISVTASQPTPPTVVRELTEKRTETSKELLLSDGTIRAQYFADPIYYRDPTTKALKPIDTTLRETSVDGKPVSVNRANRFRIALPSDLSDDEVSMEASGTRVQLKPRWKSRVGAARVSTGAIEARSLSATDRVYPSAFVGATLEYESRPDGVKETIVLDRRIKENVFGFDLTLDGLTPRIEEDRSVSLLAVGTTETVYTIPTPFMMDSSGSNVGDDYSNAVHYEITGTGPTYYLAVVADAAWLADPARVYPVRIDPSVQTLSTTLQAGSNASAGSDTFTSSKAENQATNYVSHPTLWVNTHNPAADWTEYAFCQPGTTLVSGMATKKAAGYEVVASRLRLYAYTIANSGRVSATMCATTTAVSLSGIDWNDQETGFPATSGYTSPYVTPASGQTSVFDVTSMVAHWQDAAVTATKCTVRLTALLADTGHVGFRAGDYASNKPVWEIDYAPIPTVSVTSPAGGNVTGVPTANWTYAEELGNPQAQWQLEVATSTVGPALVTAGASSSAASSALPVPSGGWVDGTTYYVRVRVASAPTTTSSRLWSPWTTNNFTIVPPVPTVSLTSPPGGDVTAAPTAKWTYAESLSNPQTQWQLEVATSTAGASVATTSASNAATSSALPVPSGGWVPGSTYYVRVRVASSPYASVRWSSWATKDFTPVLPSAVSSLSADTTASTSWFAEADTNGDGVNDLKDDAADQGRGSVALSWGAVSGVSGYNVYLFDGHAYRKVASTTATSWSTAGKGIFPTDSQIASLSAGTTSNPFLSGTGRDLRDDPRGLYAKTAGTSLDATPCYVFRVVAYNANGESAGASAEATVTLDSRTVGVNIEPQHTDYDIGDMLGHSATARLDQATIELDATDLSIASYGPNASIARHYSSETTLAGAFAPGWRFSFEQNLVVGSSVATWTDSVGEVHRFVLRSGVWVAPDGLQATMSSTGTGYRISFPGGDKLNFNLADGRLVSESDLNDNTVSYLWSVDRLTIIAANEQFIDVFFSGAQITRAEYVTGDGERSVDYEYGYSDVATVTLNHGTTDELPVRMAYNTNGYLTFLEGPPTEGYWGTDGNGTNGELGRPMWQLDYSGSKFEGAGVAWGWPVYPTFFEYGAREATITVSRDYIAPDGDKQVGDPTFMHYEWNPTGTLARRSDAQGITDDWSGEPLPFNYWTFVYDRANRPVAEVSPSGARTARTYDSRGNTISETDAIGAMRTYVYDASDRCTSETDPLGSTTYRSFDSTGNLESEEKVLNAAGERSRTEYVYDSRGLVTSERSKIDTSTWAQTTYGNFALNGRAQSTSNVDVKLSADGESQTLTSTRHYDEFGNLVWKKDATGRWTTKENTYSISGRQISSEVVTGTVSHTRYNQVGQAYESSTTAAGGLYSGWKRQGQDARGAVYASVVVTIGGAPIAATHSDLDAQGSAVVTYEKVDSYPSVQTFDASGRVIRAWAADVDASDLSAASRTVYDVEGRAIVSLAPGATASQATSTSYDAVGRSIATTSPDGTWVEYEYDHGGNVVKETRPTEDGESVKTSHYDLAGRLIAATDSDGAQTTSAYDLAGRTIGSGIVGHGGSVTVYNTLGQVLSQTDTDGMLTKTTYDEAGRVLKLDVAGKTTTTEYDEAGRESKRTDPDGLSIEREYDAFSRVKNQTHKRGAVLLKTSTTTYDTLGRASGTSQTGNGIDSVVGYDGVSGKPNSATLAYADSTTTMGFFPADGSERSRSFAAQGRSASRYVTKDGQGKVTAVAIPGVIGGATIGYDAAGKMVSQSGLGFSDSGAAYSYGESGQKASESLDLLYPGSDIENTFTYTDEGRLATSTIAGQATSYEFDDAGNLNVVRKGGETATLTYDSSRRLRTMGTTEFGWDEALGRRISMRRSGEASVTYEYTEAGRLSRFENLDASTTAAYTYGVQGQRDSSVVRLGSLTTTTTYVYDGLSLLNLAAQRSDGATYSITYSYGEDQRPWAAVYASSDTTVPTLFYLVTTDRGDVVELTNEAGQPFSAYGYDAWGRALEATSQVVVGSITASVAADITARQPLRYAGYCYDLESATYYLSARQYDPATMQFLTKDPARADGEESAYQYCGGDPVGSVDPTGLWKWIGTKVPAQLQAMSNWCWAAASLAVIKFHKPKSTTDQKAIVRWLYGDSKLNQGADPSQIAKVLRHYGFPNAADKTYRIDIDYLTRQLAKGSPTIAAIYWNGGGGHAVVVEQITNHTSPSRRDVMVMDPWTGTHRQMRYSKLANDYELEGAHGQWLQTIVH